MRGDPLDPVLTVRHLASGDVYDLVELCASGRRRFSVGRSPFANLTIPDAYVSFDHCLFYFEKRRFFVKCVGAKNRTLVNGVPLKPRSGYVELTPGTVLTLGTTELLVCGRQGEDQEGIRSPADLVTAAARIAAFRGRRSPGRQARRPTTHTF